MSDRLTPLLYEAGLIARQKHFARYRRATGAWLGFGIGLIDIACLNLVNPRSLPGLPLYQPSPGWR